ncbi:FAD-binding protein [Amycolatopsis sp. QT-25]|uniref:FAD-binding protein n=1 Tax=Amycolatopsis sp. QT-25 TaxID=3034022 RepID=UPI0023EA818B|nr:FAD-binding protein [Amycolatopsis sp. QT-25]WET81041.1 FAD-binding protein [Amycolatopsis sp. QT-25]
MLTSGTEYEAVLSIWNGAVTSRPLAVLRCADTADVQAGIRTALEKGLPLSVRGGGHDWAGRALADGGLTLDLSPMRQDLRPRYGLQDRDHRNRVTETRRAGPLHPAGRRQAGRVPLAPRYGAFEGVGARPTTASASEVAGIGSVWAEHCQPPELLLGDGERVVLEQQVTGRLPAVRCPQLVFEFIRVRQALDQEEGVIEIVDVVPSVEDCLVVVGPAAERARSPCDPSDGACDAEVPLAELHHPPAGLQSPEDVAALPAEVVGDLVGRSGAANEIVDVVPALGVEAVPHVEVPDLGGLPSADGPFQIVAADRQHNPVSRLLPQHPHTLLQVGLPFAVTA